MKTLISLEYEHKNWSWGLVVNHLIETLKTEYRIMSLEFDYGKWEAVRDSVMAKTDINKTMILSQNASQLPKIPYLENTLSRLGGNKTFENLDHPRTKQYLELMSKCAAIIVTNKKLEAIASTTHSHVYLIPNGIDLNEWKALPRKFTPGLLRVGFCGNISSQAKRQYKGYDEVVRACKHLDFPLVQALYGKGQIPHDQMRSKFWSKIDVLVLLTDGEGCSNTLMEATASGIPVIITRSAGLHGEVMQHEHDCMFSQKDAKDLVRHLRRLASNEDLYLKIAGNSRIFAETYHDIEMISELYHRVFDKHFPKQAELYKSRQVIDFTEVKLEQEIRKLEPVTISKAVETPKPKITFACVLKTGGDFDEDDVIRLHNQIRKNCSIDHAFVCLTDSAKLPNEIKTIPLSQNWHGWWAKIELFRKDIFQTERVCFMDLDTVVTGNIDQLVSIKSSFAGLQPWRTAERNKRSLCSGLMIWNVSEYHHLYEQFNYAYHTKKFRGDQDYISDKLLQAKIIPGWIQKLVPGIYSYKLDTDKTNLPKDSKIIIFHGKPRPKEVSHLTWMQRHWR